MVLLAQLGIIFRGFSVLRPLSQTRVESLKIVVIPESVVRAVSATFRERWLSVVGR